MNRGKGQKGTCRFDIAKDCFIMSFCLMGMNSADLYNCHIMEDGVITYYGTKTKDRRFDKAKMMVEIPELILPIMEKYKDRTGNRLFCFYQYYATPDAFNKAINAGLKQIGLVARAYYSDENLAPVENSKESSMWNVYNLLTGANKSSYIDNFLDRANNASVLTDGLNKALYGENEYSWFIR